jgi:hypothetical protein
VVSGEVAEDSGMIWGGEDWVLANSESPNALTWTWFSGWVCVEVGLSRLRSSGGGVVGIPGRSHCYLGVQEACSKVVHHVRCVVLRENECVTSQSHDLFSFRKRVVGGNGGGTGDVGVCSGYRGVCIEWVEVCSGGIGVCSPMLGGVVGTRR